MKGSWKRVMSGVLSVLTIATTVFQPITTYAAEPDNTASSFESQYPELETVKDKLAEDEIVTASDYTVEYGSDFDIKVDFSGIEGINDAKVKIELYEAKNEAGESPRLSFSSVSQCFFPLISEPAGKRNRCLSPKRNLRYLVKKEEQAAYI